MTDISLSTARQEPAIGRKSPGRVRGAMRNALNSMVWEGLTDNQAAVKAGLTVTAIRLALKQSHVKAYYLDQLHVRRDRERSRNIHRLCEIRDAADNMPAVNAIKVLEQVTDDDSRSHSPLQQSPGLVIVVQGGSVSANPLIEHQQTNITPYEDSMTHAPDANRSESGPAVEPSCLGRGRG